MNSLDGVFLTPLDRALEYNFEAATVLLQSVGAVAGRTSVNLNVGPSIPRLKSFHDTAKAKERLKQLRMKSLSARRRIYGPEREEMKKGNPEDGEKAVACGGGFDNLSVREMRNGVPMTFFARDDRRECSPTYDEHIGMRGRLMSNQSLANVTLSDMEDGNTLLVLSHRLEQHINIKLDLSSKFCIWTIP